MIWKTVKLPEIAKISTGKWDANHASVNGKYRFYTCASKHQYSETKRFYGNCIILPGNGANVGDVHYYEGDFDAYQRTYVVHDIKISAKFLMYHMKMNWWKTNKNKQYGSATNFIKIGNFNDYNVSYPPQKEQNRIVAKLDAAFAEIDKATIINQKKIENINRLSSKIINDLVQGLFSKVKLKKLSDVCSKITKGSSPKWQGIKYVQNPGVLFITSENVGNNNLRMSKIKYVEKKFNIIQKKSILEKGDVLTNIVGASIGRTAVFDVGDLTLANINQAVCMLRTIKQELNPYYLSYILNSDFFLNILHSGETSMARANISLGFISNLKIPVPSLDKQNDFIIKCKNIYNICLEMILNSEKYNENIKRLRFSILKQQLNLREVA